MARLLVVAHAPPGSVAMMLDAVMAGTQADGIEGVEALLRPALEATSAEVIGADAIILGTPANLGYISGALKHFFDTTYNDCLPVSTGMPFGLFVHGETDTTGAVAAVNTITTGLQWRRAQPDVSVIGPVDPAATDACWELGAAMTASLLE